MEERLLVTDLLEGEVILKEGNNRTKWKGIRMNLRKHPMA